MNIEVEQVLTWIRDNAPKHATALAKRDHLKEFRKSKKALLMIEAEKQGVKTDKAREAYAYSHPEYLELLEGLEVATEEEAKLRHYLEAAKLKISVWQSEGARKRAEMNAYNSGRVA